MKIRRIPLSKDTLLQMPATERTFFLLAGHMQNELNGLHKIFGWCLSNHETSQQSAIESFANGMQAATYARVLAGKLCEAWEAVGASFFKTKLSQRIEPKLHPTAQDALKALKSYFRRKNAIKQVRNSFAFHYSAKQFDIHWEEAANEPEFELILGGTVGNNLHVAGEIVANMAMLNGIDSKDVHEAFRVFLDDVQSTAASFTEFLEGVILVILEERFGTTFAAHGREEEIFPTRSFNEVSIPFFFQPDASAN